jgi:flagellar motor switch protein FliM
MAKILSQDEIDALLSNVPVQEAEAPKETEVQPVSKNKATTYDFRHPNRISKDQLRSLESIHDNFASQFGSSLSGFTRTVVDIDLLNVDQLTYAEFISSLSAPSCTYVFNIAPLEGLGIMDFNPTIAFSFVDRMFGGRGKSTVTERELTGIEKSMITRIADKAFQCLIKSWDHVNKFEFKQTAFETNPQFMQIIPQGEIVIVVSLQVKIQSSSGVLTLCYPYLGLEPIMEKLSAQHWHDAKKGNESNLFANNTQQILPVKLNLVALLGETRISLRELLDIKIDDVIRLDNFENDNINLMIGSKIKYQAKPGCLGHQKAVKITRVIV